MSVTLTLAGEAEALAFRQAQQNAVPVQDYLTDLLTQAVQERAQKEAERRTNALALIRTLDTTGDEKEQRETFNALREAVNENRLSDRKRFL